MWKRARASVGMLLMAGALGCTGSNPNSHSRETSAGNPTKSASEQQPAAASAASPGGPATGSAAKPEEPAGKIPPSVPDAPGQQPARSPSSVLSQLDEYVRRGLDLLARGDMDAAKLILAQARLFGWRIEEVNKALDKCPKDKPGITLVENGKVNEQAKKDLDYLTRSSDVMDVPIEKLYEMVRTDRDGAEVSMLLDDELLGNGRCQWMSVDVNGTKIVFATFLQPTVLSLERIVAKHGEATKILESRKKTKFHFYGRIVLSETPQEVFVHRFDKQPGRPSSASNSAGNHDDAAAAGSKTHSSALKAQEAVLDALPEGHSGIIASADSRRFAYVARSETKETAVVDGNRHKSFGEIGHIVFAPNGNRVAYAAKTGEKWCVVDDGKEQEMFDNIGNIVFSADGKHLAYDANSQGRSVLVVDGKKAGEYEQIDTLCFSPTGDDIAYSAKHGARWLVATAKGERTGWEGITLDSPVWSPDGTHVAYGAKRADGKWTVVIDGKERGEYTDVEGFVFSPDSRHLAYVASRSSGPLADEMFLVLDGKEAKRYVGGIARAITFSPDSQRVAYLAPMGRGFVIVNNDREGKEYLFAGYPVFSPDSKRLAYPALVAGSLGSFESPEKWIVVVDDEEGRQYDGIRVPGLVFSPDSRLVAYEARRGTKRVIVIGEDETPEYDILIGEIAFTGVNRISYLCTKGSNIVRVSAEVR